MEEIGFDRDEKGEIYPTLQNFYKFCGHGRLMAVKCTRCEKLIVPPRVFCPNCYSSIFHWKELSGRGRLKTYSIIHIAPKQFNSHTPYTIGIVELEEGVTLPGRIVLDKGREPEIGMDLTVDFESVQVEWWPQWPRYYFRP